MYKQTILLISINNSDKVDSRENWTIGVSSDKNLGIFKVPNMFLHIICLYCIGVHLSRTISGHPILLFLDV